MTLTLPTQKASPCACTSFLTGMGRARRRRLALQHSNSNPYPNPSPNPNPPKRQAVSYLRGLIFIYPHLQPGDIVAFMHAHDTSWHANKPMEEAWLELLKHNYAYSEPFGYIYCKTVNRRWAAYKLLSEKMPARTWWNLMFQGTYWQDRTPDLSSIAYPCCSTFFVQAHVLLKHALDEYLRVKQNLIDACTATQKKAMFPPGYPLGGKPIGRMMEGSWHLMLSNTSHVPPPPYCTASQRTSDVHAVRGLVNAF